MAIIFGSCQQTCSSLPLREGVKRMFKKVVMCVLMHFLSLLKCLYMTSSSQLPTSQFCETEGISLLKRYN